LAVNSNVNWQGLERWLGCLYRSTTASGENALLLTIYSLAIGCHSKLTKMGGIANSLKGDYRLTDISV
jgi:hypothetical protein